MPLLERVVEIVTTAGARLLDRYPSQPPTFTSRASVLAAIAANDDAIRPIWQEPLLAARPGSSWVDDENEGGALPPGEWWITDPAEGNINHIHGLPDWGVTVTLVRDNEPVLTVVHLPLTATTYTAVAGGGAYQDGVALRTSAKTALDATLAGTAPAQLRPEQAARGNRLLGESVAAVLTAGLVVRASVPSTLQLAEVAAGRMDLFWQFSNVRSDLAAGALLVTEAGGVVTDLHGTPWSLASETFLAAAPGVHQQALDTLSAINSMA